MQLAIRYKYDLVTLVCTQQHELDRLFRAVDVAQHAVQRPALAQLRHEQRVRPPSSHPAAVPPAS